MSVREFWDQADEEAMTELAKHAPEFDREDIMPIWSDGVHIKMRITDGVLQLIMNGGRLIDLPVGKEADVIRRIIYARMQWRELTRMRLGTESEPTQFDVDNWIKQHGVTTNKKRQIKASVETMDAKEREALIALLEEMDDEPTGERSGGS